MVAGRQAAVAAGRRAGVLTLRYLESSSTFCSSCVSSSLWKDFSCTRREQGSAPRPGAGRGHYAAPRALAGGVKEELPMEHPAQLPGARQHGTRVLGAA